VPRGAYYWLLVVISNIVFQLSVQQLLICRTFSVWGAIFAESIIGVYNTTLGASTPSSFYYQRVIIYYYWICWRIRTVEDFWSSASAQGDTSADINGPRESLTDQVNSPVSPIYNISFLLLSVFVLPIYAILQMYLLNVHFIIALIIGSVPALLEVSLHIHLKRNEDLI